MRLLPPSTIPGRILAISVRWDGLPVTARVAQQRTAIEPLLRVFEQYQVPATWAFNVPAAVDAFPRSHGDAMGHELAACCATGAATKGQPVILATLRRFRQAGLPVSTLLSACEPAAEDFQRLVRLGINLVAVGSNIRGAAEPIATLRFGLWRLATSCAIPRQGWLSGAWGAVRERRRLDQAVRRNEPFHIMVDGPAVVRSPQAVRTLQRLLRHVDCRRQQCSLNVLTLSEIARQLARPRLATTAESILRVRAA